jgi:hypothetical protein
MLSAYQVIRRLQREIGYLRRSNLLTKEIKLVIEGLVLAIEVVKEMQAESKGRN